jgi:predicted DCC family thiol-disulfide oxidoreductase YuxK
MRPTSTIEVVFDLDCGICVACVRWLQRRDRDGIIICTPSSSCRWPEIEDLPFSETVMTRDTNGEISLHSDAVAVALANVPGYVGVCGRTVLALNTIAPLRTVNDFCYRLFAKNRIRISAVLVRLHLLEQRCELPASPA